MPYQDGLRQSSVNLDPLAALRAPVTVLLGVSAPAAELLRRLGVSTVLDLATLPLFAVAREILEAANDRGSGAVARLDTVPGGYIADGTTVSLDALPEAPVTTIRGIDAVLGQQMRDVLQIETVADLARWLPFTFARQILEGATREEGERTDPASELVPRMGEYPTERCFYTTMLIDHVEAAATQDLKTAGAIDIAPAVDASFGFSAPAVGARLTFAQSWFAHGVTLGNLLHSVALAPGESTRIAVVDWSRRMRSSGTEAISEAERLSQSTSHNRAVSEVQEAVATEAQEGFSRTKSSSTTKQGGGGFGLSIGPVSLGGSVSAGKTTTSAESFSSSVGSRELAASMSQQVMDSTQQAASSVRDRRASLVMEVSEEEHETVSTRILANYNHMHALTVQYYEVIEIYRVTVELTQIERTLFIPMKIVEFDEATIRRYQAVLADAAITRRARELLTSEFGTVRVTPLAPRRPWRTPIEVLSTVAPVAIAARIAGDGTEEPAAPEPVPEPPARRPTRAPVADALPDFDFAEIARASRIASVEVVRPGSSDVFLPRDAELSGVVIQVNEAMVPASTVVLKMAGGEQPVALTSNGFEWRAPRPVMLQNVSEIAVTTTASAGSGTGRMTLQLSYHGALFPVTLPLQVAPNTTSAVCRMSDLGVGPELLEHLRANRLHYSQAIWRSLDASTIALLLSPFSFEGRPVADQVDPQPLMIAGNYVVLRMPAFTERRDSAPADRTETGPMAPARAAWRDWLGERGLVFGARASTEQLVPIPTGGVFAEAVLGRSNSAEKLDATRFWNWQDSPIPLAPPEIAAITMGSRAQPVDARPGQLGQPVLNIVNPTPLPDPAGVGASLAAIQNGGMFRDMSGLAATVGLAQAVAGNSAGAAKSAGELANANLLVAAQRDVELRRIKAQENIAKLANPAATAGTPKNITESGAALNTARELDRERADSGASAGGSSTNGADEMEVDGTDFEPGAGGGDEMGTDFMPGPPPSPFVADEGGGYTAPAFARMLSGALGVDPSDIILADRRRKKTPTMHDNVHASGVWSTASSWGSKADEEVAAITSGAWKPGWFDLKAVYDNAGVKWGKVKPIRDAQAFHALLRTSKVTRINLLVQAVPTASGKFAMGIAGTVDDDGSLLIKKENTVDQDLVIEWKGSHMRGQGYMLSKEKPFERELWLYNIGGVLDEEMIYTLATFVGRTIYTFSTPVWIVPQFTENPPAITKRGMIGLDIGPSFNDARAAITGTDNFYELDQYSKRFWPYQ